MNAATETDRKGIPLHTQVFIAMILGLIIGFTLRQVSGWEGGIAVFAAKAATFFGFLGKIFVKLLRMVIVPLVASSIIMGVLSVGKSRNLGRLGLKTFVFYLSTSLAAIMIGLLLTNVFRPGEGVDLAASGASYSAETLSKPGSFADILLRMIPLNPINALASADMLGIIFFSIFFGAVLTQMTDAYRQPIQNLVDAIFQTMMKMTTAVISLLPIGVFGLILTAVYTLDMTYFQAIGKYMVVLFIGLSLHFLVVLPLAFYLFTKRNPIYQYRHMTKALLTAFSTSSSSATLPVTMDCVEHNAGVSNKISSFVLPLGSTINMDGTALYECAGVLFIAQVLGLDLSFTQQLTVVITAFLASVGAAGIPSAGLVMIFIVLEAVGIDAAEVGFIVGTMLAVDRPLDMYRTMVNIFSDSVGAVVIARSEGELAELPPPA